MLATRVFGEALKVCHPQWLYGWRVLKGLFKKKGGTRRLYQASSRSGTRSLAREESICACKIFSCGLFNLTARRIIQ
jgi:hypothetical protein